MLAAMAAWRDWLVVSGKSPMTVEAYAWEVGALARARPGLGPGDFTSERLLGYLAQRKASGVGESALRRAVAAFRSFFRHALGQKVTPAHALPWPKVHKRRQRVLDWETALAVVSACDTATHRGTRDLAILLLILDSSIRASALCRLDVRQLSLEKRRYVVIEKGGDEVERGFGPSTAHFVGQWLAIRPAHARPEVTAVFVGLGGLKPGTPLTPWGLRAIFRKIGVQAGLTQGFSPHDLRRSFARLSHLLGAPSELVRIMGGWKSQAQMKPYTESLGPEDFEPYFPVTKLLGG
jgi:site-specific recombinase XerC